MGFWAQCLQRKPSRGGRQGRVEVANRYECVIQGDWSGLVDRWERDRKKRDDKLAAKRRSRSDRENEDEQRELGIQRKVVIGLIEAGQLGKAMNRVNSHGLGDPSDPIIKSQLTDKFSPRQRPLPETVPKI